MNQKGFASHFIIPILVVVGVASLGYFVYAKSSADSLSQPTIAARTRAATCSTLSLSTTKIGDKATVRAIFNRNTDPVDTYQVLAYETFGPGTTRKNVLSYSGVKVARNETKTFTTFTTLDKYDKNSKGVADTFVISVSKLKTFANGSTSYPNICTKTFKLRT